jgi:hypothetical protein
MSKKNIHLICQLVGLVIMTITFLIVSDSKPWYYKLLFFDIGLAIAMIPKFSKIKKRFLKIKTNL